MADNLIALRITLDADFEYAWHELTTWEKQSNWMLATKVWVTTESKRGLGTEIAAFTGLAAKKYPLTKFFGVLDLMRVVGWEKNSTSARCDVLHYGPIIKGSGTFLLTKEGDHTLRFDWSETVIAPRAMFLVIKPFILLGVAISLKRFARSLRTY